MRRHEGEVVSRIARKRRSSTTASATTCSWSITISEFDELVGYLQATDIYLTPYLNPVQIVSGTLAYAVGCGKAIVSTPYLYAEELLAHGRGFLVEFRDARSIAETVTSLLDDPDLRRAPSAAPIGSGAR